MSAAVPPRNRPGGTAAPLGRWPVPVAVALLLFVVVLAVVVSGTNAITRFDSRTILDVATHRSPAEADVARAITIGGHGLVVAVVVAALGALLFALRILPGRVAALPFVALAIAAGLTPIAKGIVNRPRPPRELWAAVEHSSGFPSGHSAQAAAGWLCLGLVLWLYGRGHRRWPLAVAAVVVLLVGVSRVVLAVHSPTDILGGWALGTAVALLVVALVGPAGDRR